MQRSRCRREQRGAREQPAPAANAIAVAVAVDHVGHAGGSGHGTGRCQCFASLAHQHLGAAVAQHLVELALAIHRVDRRDHAAELPGGDDCEHELRHALQVDGEAVASAEAARRQRGGGAAGDGIDLVRVESALAAAQEHVLAALGDDGVEGIEHRRVSGLGERRNAGVVEGDPGPCLHRSWRRAQAKP